MSKLSIVILNWNAVETTRRCVRRCLSFDRVSPRIWVVDNASEDEGWRRLQASHPDVRVIRSETNLGYGGGNNLALDEVETDYVLLLNNDAELDALDADLLVRALDADPLAFGVGPVVEEGRDEPRRLQCGGRDIARFPRTHLRPEDLDPGSLERAGRLAVEYVPGVAALLRVDKVRALGRLEESYFFGGELAELCWRARKRGWTSWIVPRARARHDTAASSRLRAALYPYYSLRNRFLFVRRNRARTLPLLFPFWIAWGQAAAVRELARGRRRAARSLEMAVVDGICGRFGGQNERVLG